MPTLECEVDRRGGRTLVACTVHNDTPDRRRIRVENRLDGPVRAAPGDALGPAWTDGAATCTLAPGERAALGYATPASPDADERPVDLRHEVAGRGNEVTAVPPADSPADPPTVPAPRPPDGSGSDPGDDSGDSDAVRPDGAGVALPPAVAAWLSALERRVAAVERGRRERAPGHATVVVDQETLAALERRASGLEARLAAARGEAPRES